jgi:tetratricopeptide (TPR) repeat protein
LAQASYELDPDAVATNRLLADIYESQNRPAQAARHAQKVLQATTQSYAAGVTWMRLALATQETAEGRSALLEEAAAREDLPSPLRAELLAQKAQLLLGQGDRQHAVEALDQALKFDPYHAPALELLLTMRPGSLPQRVESMLRILTGDPQAVDMMWELAQTLQTLGLHERAQELFDHAATLIARRGQGAKPPLNFVIQRFNAMLDANSARSAAAAVVAFAPLAQQHKASIDFNSLLAEAYAMAGKADAAAAQQQVLEQLLKELDRPGTRRSTAKELALFFTYTVDKPFTALAYANIAVNADNQDPVAQRLKSCAQVRTGQPDNVAQALPVLAEMASSDPYAALCLAEHHYSVNQPEQAKAALLDGLKQGRSGPAYRRLAALAARNNVEAGPMEGAPQVAELLKEFDPRRLEMSLVPEKYVSVQVKPVRAEVALCAPVELEVSLENISEIDVPIGREGLLSPAVSFEVRAAGATSAFTDVPLAALPAPRYLRPGARVSQVVRIDVGAMSQWLNRRVLDSIVMEIVPTVDPMMSGNAFQSTVPTLKVASAIVRRQDIMSQYGLDSSKPESYTASLGYIVRDFKQGSPAEQMRACEQVGALLAFYEDMGRQIARAPAPLAQRIQRPVMLSMCNALLTSSEPALRAHMVASLTPSVADDTLTQLLAPLASDPNWLVRMRLSEMLGPSRDRKHQAMVADLANDPDARVRNMAALFLPAERKRP